MENENICHACQEKTLNFSKKIFVYAKNLDERMEGTAQIKKYWDFTRSFVFICSKCERKKENIVKAITNKVKENYAGPYWYWLEKDFAYGQLGPAEYSYKLIKDLGPFKDELDDISENKNVELVFNHKQEGGFEGKWVIYIDDVITALISSKQAFRFSVNVSAGSHRIATFGGFKKPFIFNTVENGIYEIDCSVDRMWGGIKFSVKP